MTKIAISTSSLRIAIVGATGMVGRNFIKILQEEKINADYSLFASSRSAGTQVNMFGKNLTVLELNKENVTRVKPDFALFAADDGTTTQEYAPFFASLGCTVIDNSSVFRQDPRVPLIVPECNPEDIKKLRSNIIANPNCSTIGAVVALKPLDDAFDAKRLVYSTYQAVSGAGQAGIDDYHAGMAGLPPKKFPFPIVGNLIPQIDAFIENGNTKEEEKMIHETRKILHKPKLAISATCVRVPIENCHSVNINAEFKKKIDINQAKEILGNAPGVVLCELAMPIHADGKNEVFVGRVRLDESRPNTINLFTVSDNVRKGAALNAVQILKLLLKDKCEDRCIQ